MKNLLFAILAVLMTGCAGIPLPQYAEARAAAEALAGPATPDTVCWRFEGTVHCPPKDGSQLVLPCKSAASVYEVPLPVLPKAPEITTTRVVGVIAPTDAAGKPMAAAEVCGPGCSGVTTPAVIVEYQPLPPSITWYVQPPPKACAKVVVWGAQLGYGQWGLPSGPPLRRHK